MLDRGRAHGFVVDHVLTRSVRDSAAMLDWTGYAEDDSPYATPPKARPYTDEILTPPGKLRIAVSTENPSDTSLHPDVQRSFDETVTLLGELGHAMIELPKMGIDWRKLYMAQGCVSGAMFAASIDELKLAFGREPEENEMEPLAWASYRAGSRLTGGQVGWGLQTLRQVSRQILALWRDFDVLLSPVTITPAPPIGHLDPVNVAPREFNKRQAHVFGYTPPFNITGQPSMSVPLGWSADKLPIGMMFTGRYGDEATLYRLAAQLEQARPWIERRPPIFG